ncbi:MAG: MFS transporter [Chloroflexota bacterium]
MSGSVPGVGRVRGLYYGWVLVVTLGITETITWGIVYYSFSVFLPPMERDLGWSRGQMSGALSVATLMSALCAAPVGRWLDAHGPRLLMTVGSVLSVLLVLAWSRVESLVQFYVLWAALGVVMSAVLYEPAMATIAVWFERQRARALTALTLIAGFASTIFMPIEGWSIEAYGWRLTLVLMAAFLALTTILPHALILRRRPEDLGLSVDGEPEPRRAAGPARRPAGVSVGRALRDSAFRWLALAFSLNMVANIAVSVHLIPYLQDRGYDLGLAATATGAVGAMQVAGRIVLAALGDRVSLRWLTAIVMAMQPVSLVLLLVIPGAAGLWVFIVVFGASRGIMSLLRPLFVADLYGRERFASISGALAAFVTAATAVAPLGAGLVYDLMRSYDPLFWSFVLLSAVAAGVVLLVRSSAEETAAGNRMVNVEPSP